MRKIKERIDGFPAETTLGRHRGSSFENTPPALQINPFLLENLPSRVLTLPPAAPPAKLLFNPPDAACPSFYGGSKLPGYWA